MTTDNGRREGEGKEEREYTGRMRILDSSLVRPRMVAPSEWDSICIVRRSRAWSALRTLIFKVPGDPATAGQCRSWLWACRVSAVAESAFVVNKGFLRMACAAVCAVSCGVL